MLKNKRAELTTTQLVTIIVLIASFIIILFLIFRLNPGEQNNKEICHNSVVLRGKSVGVSGPLDCRTNYLCVSGGDSCVGPTSSTVKLSTENKNEIMEALAKEMADCWYMFGEDKKIHYEDTTSTGVDCAVCSIVEFDKKVQERHPAILYSEFYDYLRTAKKEGSETYLHYLYGIDDISQLSTQKQFPTVKVGQDVINTDKKYSIITGIDNNVVEEDEWLKVHIMLTSETQTTACTQYITKA